MKNIIVLFVIAVSGLLLGCKASNNSQSPASVSVSDVNYSLPQSGALSCYVKKDLSVLSNPYSIMFNQEMSLIPIQSNNNYYIRLQAGRYFGCVIFSKDSVLKGVYSSAQKERLNSVCEGKKDYEYTQFVDESGRPTFRLQCDRPVFEDQLPRPFSPGYSDARKIIFSQDSSAVRVLLNTVFAQ